MTQTPIGTTTPFIGIDFGTSKSSMAWYNPRNRQAEIIKNAEGEEKTPSVVYFGERETLVGKHAEYRLEDKQDRRRVIISAKRELVPDVTIALPDRQVRAVEVAAEILGKLKRDAQAFHFNQEVTRTVITCPAAFDSLQREKITEAGKLAGFNEVMLLEEPTAAALAYAQAGLQVGNHVLVYDLGAGTFDLAVVARDSDGSFRLAMEPKGLARCGGDDFDLALYGYCDKLAQQQLGRPISLTGELDLYFLRECRERKENLSAHTTCMFSSMLTSESAITRFKHQVDRTTFEQLIQAHIESTVRLTLTIIEEAKTWGYPIDTVVLIGGSSRIPLAVQLLKQTMPLEPRHWHQQDMAVALGAAYYANTLWGQAPEKRSPETSLPDTAELYRRAVRIAYADNRLSRAEVDQLDALAQELRLAADAVAAIEREVMGDVKEVILRRQEKPVSLPTGSGPIDKPGFLPGSRPIDRPDFLPGSRPKPESLPDER